ncbi:MAG TPA: hypothetical protein VMZ28_02025, partial [Kofleriaceae bacterium]|nr:hypothetical protein [Kofleriaceae bacterium]
MCRVAGAIAECGVADAAAVDADGGDAPVDGATFCGGWTYAPSNFDPCAIEAVGGWAPAPGSWFYETDTDHLYGPEGQLAEVPFARELIAGGTLRLIALDSFTIEAGILVRFSGALPVVIAVDGAVAIDGRLSVAGDSAGNPGAGGLSADCSEGAASAGDDSITFGEGGGGGGGGGFGLVGGDGGGSADDANAGGEGGQPHGDAALTLLRAGCPGAAGGVGFGG